MKSGYVLFAAIIITALASCGGTVKKTDINQTVTNQVDTNQTVSETASTNQIVTDVPIQTTSNQMETSNTSPVDTAADNFNSAWAEYKIIKKDIPFLLQSSDLKLDDPRYNINNQSFEDYMKASVIPALSRVVKIMPADKRAVINGFASKTGTEEPGKGFIGNIALSKNRALSVLEYIAKHSDLDKSKFSIRANGSSKPIAGLDPADIKNCRVSIDIE